ncbi:hypothetical protein RP75_03445 [Agrobacterium arsenijevicii]|uniref:Uncharacterized protein n=1 Tax=Agrobacterium arsenijevicii TaxID=1585697 RepID=A0ABR5DDC2_9HYPH|nr:hypothetical protein RP75_03445 [Agrobacterium arsenijevicii]
MLRILNFLEMLPVWRVRRHDTKKYLSAASGHCEFETAGPALLLAISEIPSETPCETEDADARRPVSWLGLGQSFSAVDERDGAGSDTSRLPVIEYG